MFLNKLVGIPRFELRQTEPKSVVLPLHHIPIICDERPLAVNDPQTIGRAISTLLI